MTRILIALILFNIGNVCDIITTIIGLSYGLHEMNPLIDYIITNQGFNAAIVFKLLVGIILSLVLYARDSKKTSIIAAALVWLVVMNNLIHIILKVN